MNKNGIDRTISQIKYIKEVNYEYSLMGSSDSARPAYYHGAIWKFSNSEQSVPSLSALPHGVWQSLIVIELICSLGLILPALNKQLAILAPIAAVCIAAEMLLFSGMHLFSGETNNAPMFYWLVIAVVCVFLAVGRFVLKPL